MSKANQVSQSSRRHNSLADDILSAGHLRTKSNKRKSRADEDAGLDYVDAKASRRILQLGQDLTQEEADELRTSVAVPNTAFDLGSRFEQNNVSDDEPPNSEKDAWGDEEEEEKEEVELDPNDLEMFHKFMPAKDDPILQSGDALGQERGGTNLADLILEKIAAHEAAQAGGPIIHVSGHPENAVDLPTKVVDVYTKVGIILSRYKSGKLPKPFKILPTLPQWEDLLDITRPGSWTPNACYEATRIFVSAKPHIVQQFLETVVLSWVREDIRETKRLNVHLYKALKKALYKPAGFFKGFLFPLVDSGTCTLREAHIISSVLARVSIPVLHSAAALLRLCDIAAEQSSMSTEGGGATNIFIRVLLEKKYALPYKVIDALVFHFLRFRATEPLTRDDSMGDISGPGSTGVKLPVLWHQSLLVFAQRYRNDITEDQREALLDLLLLRGHKDIGPEVRRELLAGRGRGMMKADEPGDDGGDDTMVVDTP